jgi:uncharacterized protein (DUF4415 family)
MKKRIISKTRSLTDGDRVRNMKDEDIDYSDIPKLGPDFFANAVRANTIQWLGPKRLITLRLDPDVLEFYKKTGRGYQTKMNSVLRAGMVKPKAAPVPKRKASNRKKAG